MQAAFRPRQFARLKEIWAEEHARWNERDLSAKRYVYVWADGIHLQARLEDDAQCILVIIGATPQGKKELVGLADGVRESALSWKELLLDLKRRGLDGAPELAIADGALGFWKALGEVWGKTREQRCWVHKTANVLNKLPKSIQRNAKIALGSICARPTRSRARLQPCAIELSARRAACRTKPRSQWSTSSPTPHKKAGVVSTVPTSCQN